MDDVYTEVMALTGRRVLTLDGARDALKARLLAVHPDKLAAGASPETVAEATRVFIAIRRCQAALASECAARLEGPVVQIFVPLHILKDGGDVRFSVSVNGAFREVTAAVPPGTLPPARVVVGTAAGDITVEILDPPGAPGRGGARRVPGTLDAEVDWVITSSDAIRHGEQARFDDALLGGVVAVDIPPFSPLCGAVARPHVPFSGGGIVGSAGARGDLFVYITVASGVGLQVQECVDMAEQAGEVDELQRRCARAEETLNFYQEAYASPPPGRRLRAKHV